MADTGEKKALFHIYNLRKFFPVKKTKLFQKEQLYVRAHDHLTLDIMEGETLGIVGESGCGKSTFGRVLLQLYEATAGFVMYRGRTIFEINPSYVTEIIRNLPAKKKEWEEQKKMYEEKRAAVSAGRKEPGYEMAVLAMEEAQDKMERSFYGMVHLIGGLLLSDDPDAVGRTFLSYFEAGVALEKEKTGSALRTFEEAERRLEELRIPCRKKELYEFYEAQRETGIDLGRLTEKEMRCLRCDLQLIFQDPYSSLDARMTVGQIIGEGLLTHKYFEKNNDEMKQYIIEVMEKCGLASYFFHRYPHQFSGGQRQRIGIARSVALKPKFIVCDEAVSALDVSIQSQIINLLLDLKEQENLTYMFISHDLSVVKYISDRIGVMYLGNLVELAETSALFEHPMHPYTDALLSAIPTTDADADRDFAVLEGDIPSPIHPPKGCKFHTRCRFCQEICTQEAPQLKEKEPGHFVACHYNL